MYVAGVWYTFYVEYYENLVVSSGKISISVEGGLKKNLLMPFVGFGSSPPSPVSLTK
jgi:hypothetical protein